jgi:thymidylate kinase
LGGASFRNGAKTLTGRSPFDILGRPLVIEFAGTPNSGKDTQIHILADYLRDYRRFRVMVIDELYDSSRVQPSYDYKLYWMVGSTIKNVVEVRNEKNADVVIINRGLFDILAILDLYCQYGHISKKELISLSSSLTTRRLCHIEDIVILLRTTPEVSLQREKLYPKNTVASLAKKLDRWNPNPDSTLTNKDGLEKINKCYEMVLAKYRKAFRDIYCLDDNGTMSIDDVAATVGTHIHPSLLDDKYAFPKELLVRRRKPRNDADQLSFSDLLDDFKSVNENANENRQV